MSNQKSYPGDMTDAQAELLLRGRLKRVTGSVVGLCQSS